MKNKKLKTIRHWTASEVIREIRLLTDLSAKANQSNFTSLYGAAVRYFGGWKQAIESSGLDYSSCARRNIPGFWDENKILEHIRQLEHKNSNYVRKHQVALYSAALRIFGSWKDAVEAAGFDYDTERKGWVQSDEQSWKWKKDKL